MTARTRTLVTTLALLALAALAVAFAWFGVEKKDEAAEARKAAQEKLFAFAPGDVKAVVVEAKGDVTRLARAGDAWRVEAPVAAAAERAAVDALVEKLSGLRRKAGVAPSADRAALERYGLARPRAKVTLTLASGKAERLALGDENAFDGTAFVQAGAGGVDLVDGDVKWSVERGTFDLREKRLLPFEDEDVTRVEITAPRLRYVLARDGERWRLEAPRNDRADDDTVSRVLSAIRGLRATSFSRAPESDRTAGPQRTRYAIVLVPPSGSPRTLRLEQAPASDGAGGALRARLEGSAELAALPAGAARDLDQDLFALQDKTVLRFDRDKVAVVRFAVEGARFEARKAAGSTRLGGALFALSSLRAAAFVDETGASLAAYGLDRPALEVILVGEGGAELGRLAVSRPRGGKTFAKGSPSPRIVEIDARAVAGLPRKAEDLEEPAAAKPPGEKP